MPNDGGAELAFAYHRSLAPMIWALVGLSVAALCLVHLLVALLWSGWVALALSLVTLAGIGWLVVAVRSFGTLPVLVGPERVVLRAGRIKSMTVPRADIAAVDGEISAAAAKARDMLKLSLLAHPNVVVRLRAPLAHGRREVRAIAHRLDDPQGFREALA